MLNEEGRAVNPGFHEKKQGPRLAATAPRPFAEATRRDDVEKVVEATATAKTGKCVADAK